MWQQGIFQFVILQSVDVILQNEPESQITRCGVIQVVYYNANYS